MCGTLNRVQLGQESACGDTTVGTLATAATASAAAASGQVTGVAHVRLFAFRDVHALRGVWTLVAV